MNFLFVKQAEAVGANQLIKNINNVIINPLITILIAAGFVYFLWGVAQYLLAGENEEVRSTSKTHMLYGIIGLFIMVSVFGILNFVASTIGV